MPTFQTTHRVAHSAEEMYALVADVERYPEFVPLCTGLNIISRTAQEPGEELVASMSVGHKALKDTFTTRVTLDPGTHKIQANYLEGPFHHLENRWCFAPLSPSSCEVDFYISYEFKSALMAIALGPMFDKAFRHFVSAFEDRADQIYGTPSGAPGQTGSQT